MMCSFLGKKNDESVEEGELIGSSLCMEQVWRVSAIQYYKVTWQEISE